MVTYNPSLGPMRRLSLEAQTQYAGLLSALVADAGASVVIGRTGSFVSKQIKGSKYWYFQYRDQGAQKQEYLGADSAEVRAFIADAKTQQRTGTERKKQLQRLNAMAIAGGAYATPTAERTVLAMLAEAGVFRMGGVLVGSMAFATYGNMLGIRWADEAIRTKDVDIASDPSVALALNTDANGPTLRKTMEAEGTRFRPIPAFNRKHPSTSFEVRGTELVLDLLVPMVGKPKDKPVLVPGLGVPAFALRYLDYLIASPVGAALLGGAGVLVTVPNPARFLFHKCIVAEERTASFQTKAHKDLMQARALAEVLVEDRPGDLMIAWEALAARGKGWTTKVERSLKKFPKAEADALREARA